MLGRLDGCSKVDVDIDRGSSGSAGAALGESRSSVFSRTADGRVEAMLGTGSEVSLLRSQTPL